MSRLAFFISSLLCALFFASLLVLTPDYLSDYGVNLQIDYLCQLRHHHHHQLAKKEAVTASPDSVPEAARPLTDGLDPPPRTDGRDLCGEENHNNKKFKYIKSRSKNSPSPSQPRITIVQYFTTLEKLSDLESIRILAYEFHAFRLQQQHAQNAAPSGDHSHLTKRFPSASSYVAPLVVFASTNKTCSEKIPKSVLKQLRHLEISLRFPPCCSSAKCDFQCLQQMLNHEIENSKVVSETRGDSFSGQSPTDYYHVFLDSRQTAHVILAAAGGTGGRSSSKFGKSLFFLQADDLVTFHRSVAASRDTSSHEEEQEPASSGPSHLASYLVASFSEINFQFFDDENNNSQDGSLRPRFFVHSESDGLVFLPQLREQYPGGYHAPSSSVSPWTLFRELPRRTSVSSSSIAMGLVALGYVWRQKVELINNFFLEASLHVDSEAPPWRNSHRYDYLCPSRQVDEVVSELTKTDSFSDAQLEEEGFVLFVHTYSPVRWPTVEILLEHYQTALHLKEMVVFLHDPDGSFPDDTVFRNLVSKISKPLRFVRQKTDSLNNRFNPVDHLVSHCIASVDDDIKMEIEDLEFMFHVWTENRDRLIGVFPRHFHFDPKTSSYEYLWDDESYSMVLTKLMMFHAKFLLIYSCVFSPSFHYFVDLHKNCEDIAFNLMSSSLTGQSPIVVQPKNDIIDYGIEKEESLSNRPSHFESRRLCLNHFILTLLNGHNPLRSSSMSAVPFRIPTWRPSTY